MINAIIKGITDSLQKEFENACEIVTEERGADLEGRAFMSPVWAVRKRCSGERDISGKISSVFSIFQQKAREKRKNAMRLPTGFFPVWNR